MRPLTLLVSLYYTYKILFIVIKGNIQNNVYTIKGNIPLLLLVIPIKSFLRV